MTTAKQKFARQRNWLRARLLGITSLFCVKSLKLMTTKERILAIEIDEKVKELNQIWKKGSLR